MQTAPLLRSSSQLEQPRDHLRCVPTTDVIGNHDDGDEDFERQGGRRQEPRVGGKISSAGLGSARWVGVPLTDPDRARTLPCVLGERVCVREVARKERRSAVGCGARIADDLNADYATGVRPTPEQDAAGLAPVG